MNIDETLFKTMFAETAEDFTNDLIKYFKSRSIDDFTLWSITGNVCEPYPNSENKNGAFDIFDFGYSDDVYLSRPHKEVSYFETSFFIAASLFLTYKKRPVTAVTFHKDISDEAYAELEKYAPMLGKSSYELLAREKRMDLYIDYQKKVDFVKRAGVIFKALDINDVISVASTFFLEVFSAEAVCAIHKGAFKGIGLEEKDIEQNIFIGDLSFKDYTKTNKITAFCENTASSTKFNIKNIFFVYEENSDLLFALFNILTDIVPDKEFSSLVAGIVSIAVENSVNHEKMTKFKVEETEVENTVNILNKFVYRQMTLPSSFDIHGSTYPARNAGGDFINIRRINDKIMFFLADVCGKGYSAAVFTVVLSVFTDNLERFSSLAEALQITNRFLLDKNFENRFITVFACVLDEKTRTLDYVSCGHDPAFLIHQDKTEILSSQYLPMGLDEEDYQATKIMMPESSLLFIYTDGLIEYTNFNSLTKLVDENKNKSSKDIIEFLHNNLISNKLLQRDDFTCIAVKG